MILPANFSHVVEACIGLMRREGQNHFEATDGNVEYRIELNGNSASIRITEAVDAGLLAEGADHIL